MKAGHIKGALLEYIVRNLLKNCGFTNVREDKLFTFERGGLFYINGRGAAHDADVLMNPPIQMPFTYPTQLLFECKAYGTSANLPVVRNALGLRNDINEFEIVTRDSLLKRQNYRRAEYAIDKRTRFIYQVGVASVNDFSKPAVEFAANNKIPLLSLSWFLGTTTIQNFNSINQALIDSFNIRDIQNLYYFLKDREANIDDEKFSRANTLLNSKNILSAIFQEASLKIRSSYVGLLETGDMIFLSEIFGSNNNVLNLKNNFDSLEAEIHWFKGRPNVWRLIVHNRIQQDSFGEFYFYIPDRIFNLWKKFNLDKTVALDLKERFFSRIFIFNHRNNRDAPFSIVNIDKEWLIRIKNQKED